MKVKGKPKKSSPGQMRLPWADWEAENPEIVEVAEKFILANCYNPQIAGNLLASQPCQVSETQTPHNFVDFTSLTILNKNLKPL